MKNKLLTTLLILAPFTASAQQQGLSDIVNNVSTTAESVVNLFVLGAMIAGIIFIIVGIYGMKKASDPQARPPMGRP